VADYHEHRPDLHITFRPKIAAASRADALPAARSTHLAVGKNLIRLLELDKLLVGLLVGVDIRVVLFREALRGC